MTDSALVVGGGNHEATGNLGFVGFGVLNCVFRDLA